MESNFRLQYRYYISDLIGPQGDGSFLHLATPVEGIDKLPSTSKLSGIIYILLDWIEATACTFERSARNAVPGQAEANKKSLATSPPDTPACEASGASEPINTGSYNFLQ